MKVSYRLSVFSLALLAAGCSSAPAPRAAAPAPTPLAAPEVHSVDAFLSTLPAAQTPPLDPTGAMTLAAYPLSCLDHPQAQAPARGAYLWEPAGATRLLAGYDKQRAFYGCYDWHSAANSTWTLVALLKHYPQLPLANLIREKLDAHLGKSNIAGELAFFAGAPGPARSSSGGGDQREPSGAEPPRVGGHASFERPYGQAWLLKLYGELLTWNDPDAKKWAANVAPLAQFFSKNLAAYFTKLPTPIRQGVHPNTAFDMDLALSYTAAAHDDALRQAIVATAQRFYAHDVACPAAYEPEGVSFLSPCLVEAALMSHVLDRAAFATWYGAFMPTVYSAAFRPLTAPFDASKMTKDQMAGQSHLIGLAFSRAGAMLTIAAALPAHDPRAAVLRRLAAIHAVEGFQTMDKAGYLETHWIASYALLYDLAAAPPPPAAVKVASASDR